jgi:hypothetical protein
MSWSGMISTKISGHETIRGTDINNMGGKRGVIHEQLEKIGPIRRVDARCDILSMHPFGRWNDAPDEASL